MGSMGTGTQLRYLLKIFEFYLNNIFGFNKIIGSLKKKSHTTEKDIKKKFSYDIILQL